MKRIVIVIASIGLFNIVSTNAMQEASKVEEEKKSEAISEQQKEKNISSLPTSEEQPAVQVPMYGGVFEEDQPQGYRFD